VYEDGRASMEHEAGVGTCCEDVTSGCGGWRARCWQGGDGDGAGMIPRRGRGVEARVWSICYCFCLRGDVWEGVGACKLSVRFSALFALRGEELRAFVYST
jgi:hypothetical protein